jgi:hypothetical protein
MRVHGACIIEDFFADREDDAEGPLFTCDKRQATYILKRDVERAEVFNGVKKKAKTAGYKTYLTGTVKKQLQKNGPRLQLERNNTNHTAMLEYHYQMDILLENMFPEKEFLKRNPKNWMKKMQNLVGGNTYQHPHADQGHPFEFKNEQTFPFIATHGFGQFPFQLWLLPTTGGQHKHGFLHLFGPDSLILMRGDFVHAGGVATDPRCHMAFSPKPGAGLVFNHEHHYWLENKFDCSIDALPEDDDDECAHIDASFLWQGLSYPFAYPLAHYEENSKGHMRTVLTYPPYVTRDIVSTRKTAERDLTWVSVNAQRF